jgi:predicted ester cyclase
MRSEENRRVVERFDTLVNNHELDLLEEFCTPDMVNHTLAPNMPPGLDGTREFLRNAARGQWKAARWRSVTVVSDGDFVVQFGVRDGHWRGGAFRGIDMPTGDYVRDFAVMYRLTGGRIAERWAVRDDLGMMLQLGALNSDPTREGHAGTGQYFNRQNY